MTEAVKFYDSKGSTNLDAIRNYAKDNSWNIVTIPRAEGPSESMARRVFVAQNPGIEPAEVYLAGWGMWDVDYVVFHKQ